MLRLTQFLINYMSTGWVVRKFRFILRRQSRVSRTGTNPVSIMLSTRGFRQKLHESTLCLIEADKPLCPDEEEERMEFKRSLTEMAVFEGFMRHLFKMNVQSLRLYMVRIHCDVFTNGEQGRSF